jgi:hypothetical protein
MARKCKLRVCHFAHYLVLNVNATAAPRYSSATGRERYALFLKRKEGSGEASGHVGLADAYSVRSIRQDHAGVGGGSQYQGLT